MSTALEKKTTPELERAERTYTGPWFQPSVNIYESETELVLTANMPGVEASGIDVQFESGLLSIHGKVAPRHAGTASFLLQEYALGDYHRTFEVGETIDAERISAEYSQGVLMLHLPKVERARPRRISVRAK